MSNEEIINSLRKNKKSTNNYRSNYISNLFTRTLIAIIIVLVSAIYINENPSNIKKYKEKIFESTISFAKISNMYNKTFGKVIPFEIDKGTTKMVFNDKIDYNNIEKFNNGFKLDLNSNIVMSLYDGIVVFIGEKEGYGNTIIVQGSDGVDIWYGNVSNTSVTLYDYINKNDMIGEALDNKLYLVFNKENEYLGYEEYFK
ncbi:MAG: hypothetical protein E7158_04650 [Firmicutes bacterium]|nr:hypothetical protein [Bacillota bacterium]